MPSLQVNVPVPNGKQWVWLLHTVVTFTGGLLVMKGITDQTGFDTIVNQFEKVITDVSVLIGMLMPVGTAVWGMLHHADPPATPVVGPAPAPVQGQAVEGLTQK